ncbi:MAG: proton-conducting membrane transporter [Halodesulfurarchaeum sp.]
MTTKPELSQKVDVLPGLAALALFAVMAVAILTATFGPAAGFDPGAAITKSLGYALFNLERGAPMVMSEGFLLPFFAVAFVLDAALGAAVMLARRDGGEN